MIEVVVTHPSNYDLLQEADVIVARLYPRSCEVSDDWFRLQFIVHALAKQPDKERI